jgi:hypothetical protein
MDHRQSYLILTLALVTVLVNFFGGFFTVRSRLVALLRETTPKLRRASSKPLKVIVTYELVVHEMSSSIWMFVKDGVAGIRHRRGANGD